MKNPFRYFINSSPKVIRLSEMTYIRFQMSLWPVEDLLRERGIDIFHEAVRYWWNLFGPDIFPTTQSRTNCLSHQFCIFNLSTRFLARPI